MRGAKKHQGGTTMTIKQHHAAAALTFLLALTGIGANAADPVRWKFPRSVSCHEGMPFSDSRTGILVWGGEGEIYITVSRSDLWDHRGGYKWTDEQSYSNIVSAVMANDTDRLKSLFVKEKVPGEPVNPFMLPLGRVVVKTPSRRLVSGSLDTRTGVGKLVFNDGSGAEMAMCREDGGLFSIKFADGIEFNVEDMHCMEHPKVAKHLKDLGFKDAVRLGDGKNRGGFLWELPADDPVRLERWTAGGNELFITTSRGKSGAGRPEKTDFNTVRSRSAEHWKKFWERSAKISVPDKKIQTIFDYGMYRFGAMTDPDGIAAGLQGPWLADYKIAPWSGDYHFNINVQQCYSPAYRGGHFDHLMPLFSMIKTWWPRLRENARKFCGINDGFMLPHSVDDRGTCIGGFWAGTIDHGSTAWVAALMFRYVKYSLDREFLRSDAYPFMKGAMNVYLAMMEEHDGRLSIPVGPSPEFGGSGACSSVGRDASFQLAACHRLNSDLIEAAEMLGEKPDPRWLDVEKRLPRFTAADNGIALFEGRGFPCSHRHHSHMAGLYPFNTIDVKANRSIVNRTYRTWILHGTGAWSGWCIPWASILHTHAGNADAAVQMIHNWERFFTNPGHGSRHDPYVPGFSILGRWYNMGKEGVAEAPFTEIMQMDGQCAAVTAIMELMVHDVHGELVLFAGCPDDWTDVSFENIRIHGGRKISARRKDGVITQKRIEPLK